MILTLRVEYTAGPGSPLNGEMASQMLALARRCQVMVICNVNGRGDVFAHPKDKFAEVQARLEDLFPPRDAR